jgi:MFS transporter, NNP family, nitrate/nitrite transporter
LGGFCLPTILGALKQVTGSFGVGFLLLAIVGGLGGAAALAFASKGWEGIFIEKDGRAQDVNRPTIALLPEPQVA